MYFFKLKTWLKSCLAFNTILVCAFDRHLLDLDEVVSSPNRLLEYNIVENSRKLYRTCGFYTWLGFQTSTNSLIEALCNSVIDKKNGSLNTKYIESQSATDDIQNVPRRQQVLITYTKYIQSLESGCIDVHNFKKRKEKESVQTSKSAQKVDLTTIREVWFPLREE